MVSADPSGSGTTSGCHRELEAARLLGLGDDAHWLRLGGDAVGPAPRRAEVLPAG
jgi:hypothetical protein